MANHMQVRASVNRWLGDRITLDPTLNPADRIAYQGVQGQQANEWHVSWDAERDGGSDQSFSRLFQILRARDDGDEIALERELADLMTMLGLDRPGRGATVTVYDYPDDEHTGIGTAIVRRQGGKGWAYLPDPANRPEHLRAALTLQVDYTAG